ncbi:MAG TPA: right-handed parallel beta-helix repeat-containing protein [Phycisphaerae bacterium]|nr:right-handed parallel beta-helix repeat-containing protein [Phycisphaerae bacterium]
MLFRKTIPTVLSVVVSLLLAAPAAEAETRYVDADATGAGTGTSWTDAYNDLQDALADAAGSGGTVTEIWVAQGTYRPDESTANPEGTGDRAATFQLINGVAIYGGYAGYGETDPDLRDIALHETILSGDIDGSGNYDSYHVVTADQTGAGTLLDGFTVTGAHANGTGYDQKKGGGMYVSNAAVTVSNCTFSANYAAGRGGGMYRVGTAEVPVVLEGCRFFDNQGGLMGGGIDFYNTEGNPQVLNCAFTGNTAGYGGGIHGLGGDMTVTNCLFSGNSGNNGGGAVKTTTGSPRLTNCTFTANTSNPDEGGALDASTSP